MLTFCRHLFCSLFYIRLFTNTPTTTLPLVDPGFIGFSEDDSFFLTIYLLSGGKPPRKRSSIGFPISIPLQPHQRHGFPVPRSCPAGADCHRVGPLARLCSQLSTVGVAS